MTGPSPSGAFAQLPSLGELLARFLHSQAEAEFEMIPEAGEVELHQPSGLLGPDARTVLGDALEPAICLLDGAASASLRKSEVKPPAEWQGLVRNLEPRPAIACCVGNYPQLVKDFTPLLALESVDALRPQPGRPVDFFGVDAWAEERLARHRPAEALFAVGMFRLGHQFDKARDLLDRVREVTGSSWKPLLDNEAAALDWSQGDLERAAEAWARHPAADNPVILFNRGLTALCLEEPNAARLLERAANAWPDRNAWRHLASVYFTLSESL